MLLRKLIYKVRKGVSANDTPPPPCKAVSIMPRCSSTFSSTLLLFYSSYLSYSSSTLNCAIMGYVKRKTARREHETPRRVRFRCLVNKGFSHSEAARRAKVDRTTTLKWLYKRPSNRRTGKTRPGRPPIISDVKVEEIIKWIKGHFDRRALPLQEIARIHSIKASNNTILATFARHGYHYYIPNCKPFLSEALKRKRWTFSIAN
jgi:transposase